MHPGEVVHAVGDRGDRYLAGVEVRPQSLEHVPGHLAVQHRHAVGPLAEPEAHHRHVELARVAALVVLGAEGQHLVQRQVAECGELVDDQLAGEPVDAGGHRGMGGEHSPRPVVLQGRVEVHPPDHVLADPLQAEESGVSFVGVEHLGCRDPGDRTVRPDRAYAADPEQHLLGQPVIGAAAVEPVGHLSLVTGVLLDVGVQQQQRHPADLGEPDLGVQGAAGQRDFDPHRRLAFVQQGQRERVGVQQRVALLLPAGLVQRLPEVALAIEQADPDDRYAEVAGRLEMVPGQDAQTAGVLRQHLGDAELRGEVADALGRGGVLRRVGLVPQVAGEVVGQVRLNHPQALEELLVHREHLQPLDRHVGEQPERVPAGAVPELRIDRAEELLGVRVPAPAQVAGQVAERFEDLGQDGVDSEPSDRAHPHNLPAAQPVADACCGTGMAPEPRRDIVVASMPIPAMRPYATCRRKHRCR